MPTLDELKRRADAVFAEAREAIEERLQIVRVTMEHLAELRRAKGNG